MSIKEIHPTNMTDNVFQLIGQDWMLVSAEWNGKVNAMTASWGGFGGLWAHPSCCLCIYPSLTLYKGIRRWIRVYDTIGL